MNVLVSVKILSVIKKSMHIVVKSYDSNCFVFILIKYLNALFEHEKKIAMCIKCRIILSNILYESTN